MWIKKVATTPLTAVAKVIDNLQEQTNDRANAPSIHAVREAVNNNWLSIYPIGSIYMSVNNVDPSTVFGGTWQQIKDRFLLACGDTYNNGETGGAANHTPSGTVGGHTLTVAEMPSHEHGLEGTAKGDANNNIALTDGSVITYNNSGSSIMPSINSSTSDAYITSGSKATATGGGQAHNHSFTGISADTMPPYLAVNVWVRTA